MAKKIIEIPSHGDSRYKAWAKTVTSVDKTKSNGYAFEGSFVSLDRKAELEIGTHIMVFGETGSRAYHLPTVKLHRVTADGLEELRTWEALDRSWALECRDEIADLIQTPSEEAEPNPLAEFSTEDLIAELKRRGAEI